MRLPKRVTKESASCMLMLNGRGLPQELMIQKAKESKTLEYNGKERTAEMGAAEGPALRGEKEDEDDRAPQCSYREMGR